MRKALPQGLLVKLEQREQFAHALDKQVVAEWVTSAEQLHRLRMLGCDFVQGHLLGEPSAAAAFAERADPR